MAYTKDGRQRQRSTKTSDPVVAEMWRQKIELEEEGKQPAPVTTSAVEAVERFLASQSLGVEPETVQCNRERLGVLLAAWHGTPLGEWCPPMWEALIASKRETWGPRTIRMTYTAARQFITWAQKHNVACPDFLGSFKCPRIYRKEVDALTREERDALLLAARDRYEHGPTPHHRLEPAIGACVWGGLRPKEMYALQAKDISWKERTLRVTGSKGGADRRVDIGDTLLDIFKRHRRLSGPVVRSGGRANHRNNDRALRVLCERAGIRAVSFYVLRHTYGTLLAHEGADYRTIGLLDLSGPTQGPVTMCTLP